MARRAARPPASCSGPLLGAHQSIAGGLHRALERGRSIGCQAVHIFTRRGVKLRAYGHGSKAEPPRTEVRARFDGRAGGNQAPRASCAPSFLGAFVRRLWNNPREDAVHPRDYVVAGSTRSRAFRASFPCRVSKVRKVRTPRTSAPATCRISRLRHPVLAACLPDSSSALRYTSVNA